MFSSYAYSLLMSVALFAAVLNGFTITSSRVSRSMLKMDYEGRYDAPVLSVLEKLEDTSFRQELDLKSVFTRDILKPLTEDVEHIHGMPWRSSIQAVGDNSPPLTYMPFWEWQLSFIKENLSNVYVLPCSSTDSEYYCDSVSDFSYDESTKKGGRMVNLCFASDEYRKIRMTYYDAGRGCQVFNSLWYPREALNLPLLGIDLLAFGGMKFLAVVDFHPLHDDEEDHSQIFDESILKPIRDRYPSLQGKMSAKFYDETQFFSKNMLFSRFENKDIIMDDLFPAFQEYVSAHVDLTKKTEPLGGNIDYILERVVEYDSYSAERDPAKGLLANTFGNDWAEEYVHGFLFSWSKKK